MILMNLKIVLITLNQIWTPKNECYKKNYQLYNNLEAYYFCKKCNLNLLFIEKGMLF